MMTWIKSALAYITLLVLDFCINTLIVVANCLVLLLGCLDDPAVDQVDSLPTVEKSSEHGTSHEGTPKVAITTDGSLASPIPPVEGQSHPSALQSLPPMPQDEMAIVPLKTPHTTSDFDLASTAPGPRTHTGRVPRRQPAGVHLGTHATLNGSSAGGNRRNLRYLGSADMPNAFDFLGGGNDYQLRLIVPCWDRKDVLGEASTCPVMTNPGLNVSFDILSKVKSRAEDLQGKFRHDANGFWLERASHLYDHILAASFPSDELLSFALFRQASVRFLLFVKTKDDSLLDLSIEGHQAGLALLPYNAARRHDLLRGMGMLFETRYDEKGRQEDLDHTIDDYREALRLWPRGEVPPLELTFDLGTALWKRCESRGDVSDAESAIHHLEALLSFVDGDHPLRPRVLGTLGTALRMRCEKRGSVADAEQAIRHLAHALSLHTNSSKDRPVTLVNLASAFVARYNLSGRDSDLDRAILLCQHALSLTKDSLSALNNLASALYIRYRRTSDATDLEQAIIHIEKATSLINNDDPRRALYLSNLANLLVARHDISKHGTDINGAIDVLEHVLCLQLGNHPNRPFTLHGLCNAFFRRFSASRNTSDWQRGLDCATEALSLIPSDHANRRDMLYGLLYRPLLVPLDDLLADELTLALDQCVELVQLTPLEHPDYSLTVTEVILPILLACHKRGLNTRQLLATGHGPAFSIGDAVHTLLEQGSTAPASPADHRLNATCHHIRLFQDHKLDMFVRMFDLLDLSIASSCSIETRHKQLSMNPSIQPAKCLVPEAVASAIDHGTIDTAIEFFEQGQSILLAQLSRYRYSSLFDSLHSVRPDLASRFRDLSWQVENATFTEGKPLPGFGLNHPLEDPISRANRLKTDWEDIVRQIRNLDGFRHFLRPTRFATLRQAAIEGPIILVNISELRSDAIIVTLDKAPVVVPLPFATPNEVGHVLVTPFKGLANPPSERRARDALRALWNTIVEPIVVVLRDTLHLPKNSRIWWCPTGAVTPLPLHAAGDYRQAGKCLPSLYVSSYTSTLGALIRARSETPLHSDLPNILLVGQPKTPGQQELPCVREEISLIKGRFPHATEIMDEQATHDSVLSAMERHRWVHLACHGHVKRDDPLHSHFVLHDGPLSLLKLMQQRLPSAEFAFLSACHSASSKSNTPDEFLHLAGGMQFAGFKSVIGTLWAMNDDVGPTLADEVYRRMMVGKGNADHTKAAQALNGAVKKLWRDKVPLPIWINFVHWGA